MSNKELGTAVREFLEKFVQPTVEEFFNDQMNVRRGFLAAVTVSSLPDYIYEETESLKQIFEPHPGARRDRNHPGVKGYRNLLAKDSAAYSCVRDVADARKHVVLANPGANLLGAKNVQARGDYLAFENGGRLLTEDGRPLLLETSGVIASMKDGSERNLKLNLEAALAFFESIMSRESRLPPRD